MDLALWISAGLLAFVALAGGVTKTFVPAPSSSAGSPSPPSSASSSGSLGFGERSRGGAGRLVAARRRAIGCCVRVERK